MSEEEYSTLSIKLPTAFIDNLDELRTEWGLETKGSVIEKILEAVFEDSEVDDDEEFSWSKDVIAKMLRELAEKVERDENV